MEGRNNSSVFIATKCTGEKLQVIFQDNGPGISEENLGKIFNPFFTTKPVGKGTGLGLSLSYGIIQEHGGEIRVQSKLGEGTTFTIDLPIATQAGNSGSDDAATSRWRKANGERVLVIDDEEPLLDLMREVLTASGYLVETSSDGEKALQSLGTKTYHIIICDWKMPGLNGQQIFEQLLYSNPIMASKLIFMTADVMNEKVQQFIQQHNRPCIAKPFSLREFRSTIGKFRMISNNNALTLTQG